MLLVCFFRFEASFADVLAFLDTRIKNALLRFLAQIAPSLIRNPISLLPNPSRKLLKASQSRKPLLIELVVDQDKGMGERMIRFLKTVATNVKGLAG